MIPSFFTLIFFRFSTLGLKLLTKFLSGCQYGKYLLVCLIATNISTRAFAADYSLYVVNHIRAGAELLKSSNFDRARDEFKAALQIEPACPEALNDIGVSYLRQDKNDKAYEWFQKALAIDPNFAKSLNNSALVLYKRGDFDGAIKFYRQEVKLESNLGGNNDYELQTNLANALRDKGDFKEALVRYQQVIRVNPNFAPAHNGIAQLFYGENHYAAAKQEAEKAIKLKPDYAYAYYNLGLIDSALNEKAAALTAFRQSLKHESNSTYAEDTKRQIQELSSAAVGDSGDSTDPEIAVKRAEDSIHTQKWQLAERDLNSLVHGSGAEDPVIWNNYGLSLLHIDSSVKSQGELRGRAAAAFRKAIELKPDGFATAEYNLGQVLRLLGDDSGAETAFRCAISDASKNNSSYPLAQNALGILLKKVGNYQGAIEAYRKAIMQSNDDLPVAHYNLAIVLEKMDKTREAVHEYRSYLKLAPDGKNVDIVRERLRRLGVDG